MLAICSLALGIEGAMAQGPPYYQVSGTIRDESYQPLDFVHVINMQMDKGTITDKNGRFSIVCMKTDTLLFSAMGYKKKVMPIPDSIENAFVFHDIYLKRDTFEIREVKIFPWKTYEEFKKAFLALDIADKEKERAERNIELIRQQIILSEKSYPEQGYRYTMQSFNNQIMEKGVGPTNNLLNPISWGRFIESLKSGEIRDKNKEIRKKNK
jgi:hypothetical protein